MKSSKVKGWCVRSDRSSFQMTRSGWRTFAEMVRLAFPRLEAAGLSALVPASLISPSSTSPAWAVPWAVLLAAATPDLLSDAGSMLAACNSLCN